MLSVAAFSCDYETSSPEETIAVGGEIAAALSAAHPAPRLLVLIGDLGAGKTTLVKGVAEGLGAAFGEEVTSPTFTLVHEYGSLNSSYRGVRLYHLDLYRLDKECQLEALGLEEMIGSDGLVLVEWGDKFASVTNRADGEIVLRHKGEDKRTIHVHWGEAT